MFLLSENKKKNNTYIYYMGLATVLYTYFLSVKKTYRGFDHHPFQDSVNYIKPKTSQQTGHGNRLKAIKC